MKKIILILTGLTLTTLVASCTTSIPITSPSGRLGHAINCSSVTIAQCYQKAGEVCGGRGYRIISQKNQSEGFFTPADKSLIIECNQ